jgi:hypothetical protein
LPFLVIKHILSSQKKLLRYIKLLIGRLSSAHDKVKNFGFFFYVCSARMQKKKEVVGLERGPLSLVSTTEELLDRKVAAPV